MPSATTAAYIVKIMFAVAITAIVMLGSVALLMGSTRNTDKSQTQNKVNNDVALAVERLDALLAEARSITIDANGLALPITIRPAWSACLHRQRHRIRWHTA